MSHAFAVQIGAKSNFPTVLLRILVADSGCSINDSLTALLSDFDGLSVFGCTQEPAKVLALIATVHPDVVLLDLPAGNATGLVALKKIKRLPDAPVVIVLAQCDLAPLRLAAVAAGADHYLIKATECGCLQEMLRDLQRKRAAVVQPLVRNREMGLPPKIA